MFSSPGSLSSLSHYGWNSQETTQHSLIISRISKFSYYCHNSCVHTQTSSVDCVRCGRVVYLSSYPHTDNWRLQRRFWKIPGIGSVIISLYIVALDHVPPDKSKDIHDKDPRKVTKRPLKERILWAFKPFFNPRGIGWAHEPSHLPPQPSPSTSEFSFSYVVSW